MSEPSGSPQSEAAAAEGPEATSTPPADAGTSEGTGLPNSEASPDGSRDESGPEGRGQASEDFEKRFKGLKRTHDEFMQRTGKTLRQWIDQYGGESVAQFAAEYDRLLSDPKVGPLVKQLKEKGTVDPSLLRGGDEPDEEEEWYDPKAKSEVERLRQELAQLKGETFEGAAARAEDRLKSQIEEFLEDYPLSGEDREKFKESLSGEVDGLLKNEQGVKIINNMTKRHFRRIALPIIEEMGALETLAEKRLQNRISQRQGSATDAPSSAATGGVEGEPKREPARSMEEIRRRARRAIEQAGVRGG